MPQEQHERMPYDEARTLRRGDLLVTTTVTSGCDSEDEERSYPAGTPAKVLSTRIINGHQGFGVTVAVGPDEDTAIIAVYDQADDDGYAFVRDPSIAAERQAFPFTATPNMGSAGAELMALSFRLQKDPAHADQAKRVQEIGAWTSMRSPSDLERGAVAVMGSMMAAMRRRGFAFSDDLPVSEQFAQWLDAIPDPLPGQPGHVEQRTLNPLERRDVFEAQVDVGEVRHWAAVDTDHAYAHDAAVRPDGVAGRALVHAVGDAVKLLVQGTTVVLRLRSSGGALEVVGPGIASLDKATNAPRRPSIEAYRNAAILLGRLADDQEAAAFVAKGIDMALEDGKVAMRYATTAVDAASSIRDALNEVAR